LRIAAAATLILGLAAATALAAGTTQGKASPRSAAAQEAMRTMVFDKGKVSFTARNVALQELFKTLADQGQFSIENVDLIPQTPVSVSFDQVREQECFTQLLQQIPEINFIFLTKNSSPSGRSAIEKVQIYPQDSTGIAPGSRSTYNPADALMNEPAFGGNLFGGEGGDEPKYIPPEEPPKYIPPEEPPAYIPPDKPPEYIPPDKAPVYIAPGSEEGKKPEGGE
jgi:hypothetical protein